VITKGEGLGIRTPQPTCGVKRIRRMVDGGSSSMTSLRVQPSAISITRTLDLANGVDPPPLLDSLR